MTQAQLPTSAILAYHSLEKSGAVQLASVGIQMGKGDAGWEKGTRLVSYYKNDDAFP